MAAYAALVSLTTILDQIKNHTRHPIFFDKNQDHSLRSNLAFFLQFLETYSHVDTQQLLDLETRIKSAAHEAEDVIEFHVVDQLRCRCTLDSNSKFLRDLQDVIDELESIKEEATKIEVHGMNEVKGGSNKHPSPAATSSRPPLTTSRKKNGIDMVGFDNEREQIMEKLACKHLSRVISIVGMGGSGKTTLAESIFDDSFVVHHFDVRIWITVSQEYTLRHILLQIPICQENAKDSVPNSKLGEVLYKSLMGRRYLVILDDLWSLEAWDEINLFLPDNDKTSRIVLTTRQSNVAAYFGSTSVIRMKFLDRKDSWRLFCRKAFAQKACPHELVNIGKEIVRKCRGLPLSITVMGGLVATSSWEKKYWEGIAEDINSVLNSADDEYCLNVLSLSYKYLPIHLKPCFLYMGILPEDTSIACNRLIVMWVAEGFLRFDENKSLEEVGEGCLQDLMDRNLILVGKKFSDGKMSTCYVHDLLRDLCQRQAKKEGFYCVLRRHDIPYNMYNERRLVYHERNLNQQDAGASQVFCGVQPNLLLRSMIWPYDNSSFRGSLLRILDVCGHEDIFQQINLRFVCYRSIQRLPSSISFLWNLQTLICCHPSRVSAPPEIWDMQQLRHIAICEISLPDPPSQVTGHDVLVMENLQTLSILINFTCSDEVLRRIPNVKTLGVKYDDCSEDYQTSLPYNLQNLRCLHKLETLGIFNKKSIPVEWIQSLKILNSLNVLILYCKLRWEDLEMIGSLPYLRVLGLENVEGTEWNPTEGQFLSLKALKVKSSKGLIHWNADNSHFPVLQYLRLDSAPNLEEIPSEIGDIATLERVYLSHCKVSAAISAKKLVEEQESLGNEGLEVWITLENSEFKLFSAWLQSEEGKKSITKNFWYRKTTQKLKEEYKYVVTEEKEGTTK